MSCHECAEIQSTAGTRLAEWADSQYSQGSHIDFNDAIFLQGIPAALAERMYASFMDDIASEACDSDACGTAKLLIGLLTSIPAEEDGLRDNVNEILSWQLGQFEDGKSYFRPLGTGQSETDGTLCFRFGEIMVGHPNLKEITIPQDRSYVNILQAKMLWCCVI